MAELKLKGTLKTGQGVYQVDGVTGTVTIGPQLLADGAKFPGTITVDGLTIAEPKAKPAKLTKEERAAKRANMTEAEKLAEQEARLKKQADNLAKRKAALAAA